MTVFKVRVRAGNLGNWSTLKQRATLPGDPRKIRAGDNPAELAEIVALRGVQQLVRLKMVSLSAELSIMKDEVTVGLFKQVMEGYAIKGHNADNLKALLASSMAEEIALTYVSLLDAREFAKQLSYQTGRKFRVQTEEEWSKAKGKLSGSNWTWTEALYSSSTYVLCHLRYSNRGSDYPGRRLDNVAARLVEDLPDRQAGK